MLMGVLKPLEVKHIREVQAAVEDWEARVRRLEEEYQDKLDDSLRVAVLVSFLPESLQERVFELERGGSEVRYEAAKEVVVATAVRKAEQRKPKESETMAVGIESGGGDWDGGGSSVWGEECDVDAVGMGKGNPAVKCHRCGGVGHFARECATPWDMSGAQKGGGKVGGKKGESLGKGEGKPKGKGKGFWSSKGQGEGGKTGGGGEKGKAVGKGYQGVCYGCGQRGHKMGEWACPLSGKGAGRTLGAVEEWTQEAEDGAQVKELGSVEAGGMRAKEWDLCEVSVGVAERCFECCGAGVDESVESNGVVWRTVMSQRRRKEERRRVAAQMERNRREKRDEGASVDRVGRWRPVSAMCKGGQSEQGEGDRQGEDGEEMRVELEPRFIGAVEKEAEVLGMTSQVAAVKKALAAVWRICRAGNVVQFGDEEEDCFIKHKTTGKKVRLRKKGGSYVLRVELVRRKVLNGGEMWESLGREEVTIDSGAEESVCPKGWGEGFGMVAVTPGCELRMINAGGGEMSHFGSRKVTVTTGFF